ncbi:MAG TPA: replication-relaxation family protein [candidate division Zixibacteria bacterium]|nr:replication-relaxation family protein [candidate division Zixibacteria bacterium]
MTSKSFRMTERDGDVLLSIYKHRFLTITQIQRMHFPSMQTAYRRIRLLKQQELLSDFTIPNIEESIITVSRRGLVEVAGLLGVDMKELSSTETKSKPKDYYFMRHFLAINDFRIQLDLDSSAAGIKVLGFIPDYLGERTPQGGVSRYIRDVVCDIEKGREEVSHTPDGVFVLEREDKAALFFLEIDRGTEGISHPEKGVFKAIRFYTNYLISGQYQRYSKDFNKESFKGFRVLFVTTSRERIENIRQSISGLEAPIKSKLFVWLSTFEKLNESGIFGRIWVSALKGDNTWYSLKGRE